MYGSTEGCAGGLRSADQPVVGFRVVRIPGIPILPARAFARADAVIGANKAGPALKYNFVPSKEVTCMKIKPMNDRILVVRVEEEQKSPGGIIIPDTAKEKPQEGKVVSAGPGKVDDEGKRIPLTIG